MNYTEKAAIVRKAYPTTQILTLFVIARTKVRADRLLTFVSKDDLTAAGIAVARPIIVSKHNDWRSYYYSTVCGRTAIGVLTEEFSILPDELQDALDRSLLSASYALKVPVHEMFQVEKL